MVAAMGPAPNCLAHGRRHGLGTGQVQARECCQMDGGREPSGVLERGGAAKQMCQRNSSGGWKKVEMEEVVKRCRGGWKVNKCMGQVKVRGDAAVAAICPLTAVVDS